VHLHRALSRIASIYGRLTGVLMLLYGGSIFAGNVMGMSAIYGYDTPGIMLAILAFGMVGFLSALGFLLSFDGPSGWRTTKKRAVTWIGMFLCALLPSSPIIIVLPMVVLAAVTILVPPDLAQVATPL
jgi:hypothetical protein